jgi:hypothetical protein
LRLVRRLVHRLAAQAEQPALAEGVDLAVVVVGWFYLIFIYLFKGRERVFLSLKKERERERRKKRSGDVM